MESLPTITIDAYGAREQIVLMGQSHRHEGVIDQARHDGEMLLSTLDRMKVGEGIIPEETAIRLGIRPETIDEVAAVLCKALVGATVRFDVRKAYNLPSEPLAQPLPVDERARAIAVRALLDLR